MSNNNIELAVIDMAGTTVADDGLVVEAFEAAATAGGLADSGPERDHARQYVLDTMGQSKITVFRALFDDESTAQRANAAFEDAYAGTHRGRPRRADTRRARGVVPVARGRHQGRPDHRVLAPTPKASSSRRWAGTTSPIWSWPPARVRGAAPTPT